MPVVVIMWLCYCGAVVVTLASITRWRTHELPIRACFYTYSALHCGVVALFSFSSLSVAGGLLGGVQAVMAAGSLLLARLFWHRHTASLACHATRSGVTD